MQRNIGVPSIRIPNGLPGATSFTLAHDSDAERWIKKARDAAERTEWKVAVDALWRVIDQYPQAIVGLQERMDTSAAEAAWVLLQTWPREALDTYRTLFEPEAARLLSEAEHSGDVDRVRRVAARYRLTRSGAAALDLLATWSLDEGRPSEAAAALRLLEALPEPGVETSVLRMRLAVAEAACGRKQVAESIITQLHEWERTASHSPLPAGWNKRLAEVVGFVATPQRPATTSATREVWAGLLGGGESQGRSLEIEPSIELHLSTRLNLPGTGSVDAAKVAAACERYSAAPSWQLAADAERIYVRTASGVAAVDPTTTEVVWQSQAPQQQRTRSNGGTIFFGGDVKDALPKPKSDQLDAASLRALADDCRGALSLADGCVFIIETPREIDDRSAMLQQFGIGQGVSILDDDDLMENTLHAYDAATGKALWSKGAGGPIEDGLQEAHFFATPVACPAGLVAPLAIGNDFFLGVFRRDGTTVRKVLMGVLPAAGTSSRLITPMAVSQSLLFVPTGGGVLLALSADDLSLRWAAHYPQMDVASQRVRSVFTRGARQRPVEAAVPLGWASNPPMVCTDLVILAPPDASALFAFDRETGEKRWEAQRNSSRYLIGCDEKRVWTGGGRIEALRIADGSVLWSNESIKPTGRPVLSGRWILVPTLHKLVRLDAERGTVVPLPGGEGGPTNESTFGNLFVWQDSLFNLTAGAIEGIPDVARSIANVKERVERAPNDRAALLKWAVLESSRGNAAESRRILAQARAVSGPADPVLDEQIAHWWAATELDLAEGAGDAQRETLLRSAVAAARRPSDSLKAELALLAFETEAGRVEPAFKHGLDLLGRVGGQIVELERGHVGLASIALSERLERLWREMKPSDQARTSRQIEDAIASAGHDARIRLADAMVFTGAGRRLNLAMAIECEASGAAESAEFFLRRLLTGTIRADAEMAGEALGRLVRLHIGGTAGAVARPDLAASELRRLRDEFSAVSIPSLSVNSGHARTTGRAFVETWSKRLPGGGLDAFEAARESPRDFSQWRMMDQRVQGYPVLVLQDGVGEEQRLGDLAVFNYTSQIYGLETSAGSPRSFGWACDMEFSPLTGDAARGAFQRGLQPGEMPNGAVWGTAAIVPADGVYYPVSLANGRMLGAPIIPSPDEAGLPEPRVAAADGCFIIALDAHTVVGMYAREDAAPIWRREFGDVRIDELRAVDGCAVLIDRSRAEVLALRPQSGRTLARMRLSPRTGSVYQPADTSRSPIIIVGSTICTADDSTVYAWHAASGRSLWRLDLRGGIVDLRSLGGSFLGASCGEDRFCVVDAAKGALVAEIKPKDAVMPPIAAAVDHGRLLLCVRLVNDSLMSRLDSVELGTGESIWSRGPFQHVMVNDAMFRTATDVIPVSEMVERVVPDEDGAVGPQARLWLVDKQTGSRVGRPIVLPLAPNSNQVNVRGVRMFSQQMLVTTPIGYYVIGSGESFMLPPAGDDSEKAGMR